MKFLNKIHQKINQVTLKSILSDTMSNIRYNRIYTKNCSSIAELRGKHFNKIGVKITDIHTDDGDLEDVFVELTKN